MAPDPYDDNARRLIAGLEKSSSEKDVERQTGRHDPGAAAVAGDIWIAGSLEVITSEESAGPSAVASTTEACDPSDWLRPIDPVLVAQIGIAWRRIRDEGTSVAAVAAVAPKQAGPRFLRRGARLAERDLPGPKGAAPPKLRDAPPTKVDDRTYRALALVASLGFIGIVAIRVVLSLPEPASRGLLDPEPRSRGVLDSVATVAIGGIVSSPAPRPIEPRALVDAASVVISEPEPIVPPAGAVSVPARAESPTALRAPSDSDHRLPGPRTVRPAQERPTAEAAVKPPATRRLTESPSPAVTSTTAASTSDSARLTPSVSPSEPIARLPAAVDPQRGQRLPSPPPEGRPTVAAAAPISAEISGAATDQAYIQALLNRYQNAFNSLNAGAAKTVWPSVDERSLGRAFDQLKRQEVVFDACQTAVTGLRAVTSCQGHASYVPKVGNKIERIQAGRWTFKTLKGERGWMIEGVESRAISSP
jgi:hypothetical protein